MIQYDWCPDKRRTLGHRHTQRADIYVKTEEMTSYKLKREASEVSDSTKTLILNFQPLQLYENKL